MEAPSISGAYSSTALAPARVPAPAAAPAVKTELPPAKAVTPIGQEPAVKLDISNEAHKLAAAQEAMKRVIEKHIDIDEEMRIVIVKSVDQSTGRTISQLPDQVSLQLRAYMRGVIEKLDRTASEQQMRTDSIA